MMQRLACQLVFCDPHRIIRQGCVERNEVGEIVAIYSLHDRTSEPSNTLFLDGILSRKIISLKKKLRPEQLEEVKKNYQYLDLSEFLDEALPISNSKPILIDFGTSDLDTIHQIIKKHSKVITAIPTLDFITASVYLPSILAEEISGLEIGMRTELLLWQHTNLIADSWDEKLIIKKIEKVNKQ